MASHDKREFPVGPVPVELCGLLRRRLSLGACEQDRWLDGKFHRHGRWDPKSCKCCAE